MEKTKKSLLIYIGLTFALTWAYEFGVVWPAVRGESLLRSTPGLAQALVAGCMFFPALCTALTRLITREGFHDTLLLPRFKGHARYYLFAWLGIPVLVILGAALYYLVFPAKLDWSAPYFRQQMEAAGAPYEAQAVPMSTLLLVQLVQAFLLSGIVNLIPSLGEEWGWRGYMVPKLTELLGRRRAALAGGLIWGLWHAPLTALGHNYGLGYHGFPWTGIGAMCLFCVAFGTLLMWLTSMTGSCLPAAVAHGALNGTAALGMMVSADGGNPFVGPAPTGILGGAPVLLLAALLFWGFGKKKTEE